MIEYYSPHTYVAASLGVTATSTSNDYNNNNYTTTTAPAQQHQAQYGIKKMLQIGGYLQAHQHYNILT
jgi:capsid protein